jgi:hypothetical protein
MTDSFGLLFGTILRHFRARRNLLLENLVLRQRLVAHKRKHSRTSLGGFDKIMWVAALRFWSGWKHSLIMVSLQRHG